MLIRYNEQKDLINEIKAALARCELSGTQIGEELGITRSAVSHFYKKKNFSLNDAKRLLDVAGYDIMFEIVPKVKNDSDM